MAKKVGTIKITAFDDGQIAVSGIPSDFKTAMQTIQAAQTAICEQFMQMAMDGKIKKKRPLIEVPGMNIANLDLGNLNGAVRPNI